MYRRLILTLFVFFVALSVSFSTEKKAIIIDHTCTDAQSVPFYWLSTIKNDMQVAYGHTSHGSQLIRGISLLSEEDSRFNLNTNIQEPFSGDLGNPDFTTWEQLTRTYLTTSLTTANVIMWSWCGELNGATEENVTTYLTLMNQMEIDFPNIKFIYMTGHLDGSGKDGNLNIRNSQIRKFCNENAKILYDFADIESYDPDGRYFLEKYADDNCEYMDGDVFRNWAQDYCLLNPDKCPECADNECAHSQCLNCYRKGGATLWLMATIAGWDGKVNVEEDTIDPESVYLYQNFPNPAYDFTSFKFYLPKQMTVSLDIFDLNGKLVQNVIKDKVYPQGETITEQISIKMLPSATYEYRLIAGDTKIVKSMSVVK